MKTLRSGLGQNPPFVQLLFNPVSCHSRKEDGFEMQGVSLRSQRASPMVDGLDD